MTTLFPNKISFFGSGWTLILGETLFNPVQPPFSNTDNYLVIIFNLSEKLILSLPKLDSNLAAKR